MTKLETLLQQYADGTLTPEGQDELNRLTHRDQVLASASMQAGKIRRKRIAVASTVATTLIAAGILFPLTHKNQAISDNTPLVAQNHTATPAVDDTTTLTVETTSPATTLPDDPVVNTSTQKAATTVVTPAKTPAATAVRTEPKQPAHNRIFTEPAVTTNDEPIVACNTQCSPDSVINDIWNFLNA